MSITTGFDQVLTNTSIPSIPKPKRIGIGICLVKGAQEVNGPKGVNGAKRVKEANNRNRSNINSGVMRFVQGGKGKK